MENSDIESIDNIYYTDETTDRINERTAELKTYSIRGIGVGLGLSVFF